MRTSQGKKALIIGGGVAGPAAALALQRIGIEATVCEAEEQCTRYRGSFLVVARNGVNALRTLDAFEPALARGFWVAHMELHSGSGRRLGELGVNSGGLAIERGELATALRDEAIRRGIAFQTGKRLLDAQSTPQGVTAQFADGTEMSSDLLIGADGIHSRVRTLIDPQAPLPQFTGLVGTGGLARLAKPLPVPPPPETFLFAFGRRAFFGWIPAPTGEIYWFTNLPQAREPERQELAAISREDWRQQLLSLFADDAFPACDLIRQTAASDGFQPNILHILQHVPLWHRHTMVLVGDAVHGTTTSSGQGASLALEDSLELARCLRDASDVQQAFRAYEQLRRPRVERVASMGRRGTQAKVAGPLLRRFQDLVMPLALKLFLHPEKESWLYDYQIDLNEPVSQQMLATP
jgi:2-polyprenyl-6-methoxyphenol hydroxylase-like FAD-dependent oxidoreductase